MNSVKLTLILIFFQTLALADAVPFNVAMPLPPSPAGTTSPQSGNASGNAEAELVTELKIQAVSQWLQGELGPRYPQYARAVTAEFAERYVVYYSVNHPATQPPQIVLSGTLDADALKKWIQMSEARAKSSGVLKVMVLMSSSLSGAPLKTSETQSKSRDSTLGSALQTLLTPPFHRLGAQILYAQSGAPEGTPPVNDKQMRELRDYGNRNGANVAIWSHLIACPSCVGPSYVGSRLEIFLYNLAQNRMAGVISEDIALSSKDSGNPELLKAVLTPLTSSLQSAVESLVADGKLLTTDYRIVFEGIDTYPKYKAADQLLSHLDFVSQPSLKRAATHTAEFEVLSSYAADELLERLQQADFLGERAKVFKRDPRTLVVKAK